MLPECVDAVKKINDKIEIYVDGGIRKGSDVVKALCLGANCAFFGRPIVFSNACEGK